jgi:hypothetical protein
MSVEYKSLKVPVWCYDNLVAARGELVRHGIESVPVALREPPVCPRCGGAVEHLTVEYEQIACKSTGCGYRQQAIGVQGNTLAAVGLGVVLGIGATALLIAIANAKNDPPTVQKKPARRALPAKRARARASKR